MPSTQLIPMNALFLTVVICGLFLKFPLAGENFTFFFFFFVDHNKLKMGKQSVLELCLPHCQEPGTAAEVGLGAL